ncbi:MAG: ribulose-phosphate 3-epimerase [Angelakisella sp.]
MITISPSLLAADFARLGVELQNIKLAGADMLHLDVMDGHFVPNISFGMPVIAALRKVSDLFFDVHIMISEPQKYLAVLKGAGADLITFHCEAQGDPAGISLSPDTPVERVLPYIAKADLVLVMTVVPGFGGQKFREDMMPKLAAVAARAAELGRDDLMLQVDGGITRDTIGICAQNGANSFVAGSAVFGSGDYKEKIAALRLCARSREEMS